jgi:hypothetical protein
MKIESRQMTVTAKQAEKWVDAHEQLVTARNLEKLNRSINDALADRYGRDMKEGRWQLNGETIIIAKTGRILDGQHRLWGCINHEASFETLVAEGVEEDTFHTINTGRVRSASDILSVEGVNYSNTVAAAARLVMAYQRKDIQTRTSFTRTEIHEFVHANPRLQESAARIARIMAQQC